MSTPALVTLSATRASCSAVPPRPRHPAPSLSPASPGQPGITAVSDSDDDRQPGTSQPANVRVITHGELQGTRPDVNPPPPSCMPPTAPPSHPDPAAGRSPASWAPRAKRHRQQAAGPRQAPRRSADNDTTHQAYARAATRPAISNTHMPQRLAQAPRMHDTRLIRLKQPHPASRIRRMHDRNRGQHRSPDRTGDLITLPQPPVARPIETTTIRPAPCPPAHPAPPAPPAFTDTRRPRRRRRARPRRPRTGTPPSPSPGRPEPPDRHKLHVASRDSVRGTLRDRRRLSLNRDRQHTRGTTTTFT